MLYFLFKNNDICFAESISYMIIAFKMETLLLVQYLIEKYMEH